MPVRDRAARLAAGEVAAEPRRLRRAAARLDVAVERHGVPAADLEAVVPQARRPGVRTEIFEVWLRARRLVLVVARHGARPASVSPPCRPVAVAELLARAVKVLIVAEREHRAADAVQQPRGGFRVQVAHGDVAGADERLQACRQHRRRDRRWNWRQHLVGTARCRGTAATLHADEADDDPCDPCHGQNLRTAANWRRRRGNADCGLAKNGERSCPTYWS